jgi:hypothetical protein
MIACVGLALSSHDATAQRGLTFHEKINAELAEMSDTAKRAAADNNCVRKGVYANRLWEIHQDGNNAFWRRNGLDGESPSLRVSRQQHLDFIAKEVAAINALPCPRVAAGPTITISALGGGGNVNIPPTNFLGLREPGTFNERIGVISPNANTSVAIVGGNFVIDLANWAAIPGLPGGPRLDFGYSHTWGDRSQNFLTLDPRGNLLLVPGTGDPNAPFPPGVALGSGVPLGTPGGFNVVENMFYQRTLRSDVFTFTAEQPLIQAGPVTFSGLVGLNFSRTSIDEQFKFSVPRFLTDGAYKTNMDFFTFAPAFGGGVYVAAGDILGTGQVQTVVYGKGAVGPAFTSVDGTDRFGLSGFISTNQAVNLSGDHTGFFGSFTGGVRVVAGDFFGDGSVTYITSDSFGNIVRTGQTGQTSRVNFERGDATIFKFTFGTQFRGGVFVTASDVNR